MDEQNDNVLLLHIQSLIVDKSMVAANAYRDIAQYGEWGCNYNEEYWQIDSQIDTLFSEINNQN